jgi:hypothetical protein
MADICGGDGSPDRLLMETNDRSSTWFLDTMNFTDSILMELSSEPDRD